MNNHIPNFQDQISANPILYLDFDGVILAPEWEKRPNQRITNQLNRIIRLTQCKIVITSAWKIYKLDHNIDIAHSYLKKWGIVNADVVGFSYGVELDKDGLNGRELEIYYHVNKHKPLRWCAVDDSIMDRDRMVRVPSLIGITKSTADKIINWLRKDL